MQGGLIGLALLGLFCVTPLKAHAQNDKRFGMRVDSNTVLHFAYSAAGACAASLLLPAGLSKSRHLLISSTLGMIPGIAKEIDDMNTPGNHFDLIDLLADGLGAGVGAAMCRPQEQPVRTKPVAKSYSALEEWPRSVVFKN